jgi:ATP-dependent helicase Lhr and Lhr-like helicase
MKARKKKTAPEALLPSPLERIENWFATRGWKSFPFQREVWQAYLDGESGLIHAATGTGKTLAAYLGCLLEAMQEPETLKEPGLRLLWITPLRALASDTMESLELPLVGLNIPWKVESRTGDTKASVRARQKSKLPQILVTTPESLTLFLTRPDIRELFSKLKCIIIDEWHELLSSKRGVMTELALARLRRWQPNLKVWGVSATLGNIDVALQVLLGPYGKGRIIRGAVPKEIRIDSIIPTQLERFPWAGHIGLTLLPKVIEAIEEGETSLVFTNTRSQTEIWYQAILQARPDWAGIIALHHGSLDRKVRDWVETGLKEGKLRCVVCTSSLDLGVDFSPVDRVIQIGSPKGVARLLQRAGRSGHSPGRPSRVTCIPTNALELIEVAAARDAAVAGLIEGREPIEKPLDLLSQHAVTLAIAGGFDREEFLQEVRQTWSYRNLTEEELDWVLDFVVRGGQSLHAYPEYRRVTLEDGRYTVTDNRIARRHKLMIGTIAADASIQVKYMRGGKLGHVEESFITKLKPGDHFVFAGKTLELIRIHEMTAIVKRASGKVQTVPRWMGGRMPLSSELAAAVRDQLHLARDHVYATREMDAVRPILEVQSRWSMIPGPEQLLIERLHSREGYHLFFYPFEGRMVHEGLSCLLAYRLGRRQPISFSIAINDYGFELLSPDEPELEDAIKEGLLDPFGLMEDILESLNSGEMAKRQFREIARIAGLIFTGYPGEGRSNKQLQASSGLLFDVFREYDPNNLLLHQSRREVLERQFEQTRLAKTLTRLHQSQIQIVEIMKPTPLNFPLLVDRLRAAMSSESVADRVKKMSLELEKAARS